MSVVDVVFEDVVVVGEEDDHDEVILLLLREKWFSKRGSCVFVCFM